MEWVEAQGKSVEDAVEAALAELQLASPDEASIEVLQEPKAGFLGMGGRDAVVKVMPKPRQKRRRRRRSKGSNDGAGNQSATSERGQGGSSGGSSPSKSSGQGRKTATKAGGSQGGNRSSRNSGANGSRNKGSAASSNRSQSSKTSSERGAKAGSSAPKESTVEEANEQSVTIEEQAEVAGEFLKGLLGAFGLEGDVSTRVEDEILFIEVNGDQTEALVGHKGAIMQSVLELTRTVIQRKTYGAPRMRIDIAGYAERRREALKIYTGKLVEKVLAEKGEIMLEPMNPADRKVIHDAVGDHDGVRSFSEGQDPHRSVVIAPVD